MAYSPSRRSEDRYVRDRRDDRGTRRRSRSRERDRDSYRRRDRSYDRYDDRRDDRRYGRRDRSRDRKRSRDRSPVRDRRDERDRYRDSRDAYDNRDRKRPRRSNSPKRDDRARDSGRDRRTPVRTSERGDETPRPPTANTDNAAAEKQAEEKRKQEERRAKMEAWKAKLLADKAQESPSASTPPTTTINNASSNDLQPAGKPDPKEIQKRLRAAKAKQEDAKNVPLGGDVAIPTPAPEHLASNGSVGSSGATPEPGRITAKVTGFGLNKAVAGKTEIQASKAASALDEGETSAKPKLGKLPSLPSVDVSMDAIPDNTEDEDDDGNDLRSNDDADKANREAVQRRALQLERSANHDDPAAKSVDTAKDAGSAMDVDEDDEIDPLDAFMNSLEDSAKDSDPLDDVQFGKKAAVVFNGDDEGDLDAIGSASDDIAAMMKKTKKKDFIQVDHAKMNYQPFRKNFYNEPIEISEMTDEDIEELRADLDNITVKGKSAPRPIQKFAQGGFGAHIMQIINQLNFSIPSSIQAQALPAIMSGRDTIGVAKTGSGKTMAFVLPMFRHIKDQPPLATLDGPIGLIMAPTRELAVQIHRDCKPFLRGLNLRAVCAYGGAPIKDQIAELKRGAEIVVATPGRMIDLLSANSGRVTNLRRVSYVVMDEADRMFDMGFEPQITKILMNIRPDRQTILFSATFPPKMEAMARKALRNPVEILVGGKSVVASEITQVVEVREANTRFNRLLQLLGEMFVQDDDVRCLVFVERQETADILFKELSKKGYASVSIHGGREQIDRDEAIQNFKQGIFPIMIATSVAARGLDVKQLRLVVNFDCPNHNEDYVHRCGRTGRAGNTGTAVTFVMPDQERFAAFLAKSLTDSNQEVPEDLKAMAEKFNKKVESGEAKKYGGGFGGKGIERLDAARQADEARIRKQYRTEDQPEEEDAGEAKKEGGEDASGKPKESTESLLPAQLAAILKNAMNVQKAETPPPAANDGQKAGGRPKALDPMEAARQAAMNITNRVGGNKSAARPGQHVDNHGPDAGAFHATLEINDFPQRARWAVTNRTNTSKILDTAQVSITTKGNYYAPPKVPGEGELPKLYILVEGPTKIIVEDSMAELVRLLKEGTIAALEGESSKPQAGGRYSVV